MNRVVVTGEGLITALGKGLLAHREALAAGRSGVAEAPGGDGPAWVRWAGRVADAALPEDLPPKQRAQAKFLNRGGLLIFLAAGEATQTVISGSTPPPPARRSLYVATGDHSTAGCEFLYEACREASGGGFEQVDQPTLNQAILEKVNPFFLLESIHNNPFSFISAAFECMGPGTTLAAHSPSGNNALELAFRAVRQGRTDLALAVGGGSWVDPVTLYELSRLGILSTARTGGAAFRPFDAKRDGFLAGEGAAALVLESELSAQARGVPILGVIEGVGNAAQAGAALSPSPEGIVACLREALADAGCGVEDLGLIIAHGSGTLRGDAAELEALTAVLGASAPTVPVCALKPFTGHMGAASDVAEIILGLDFLRDAKAPGIPNFHRPPEGFSWLAPAARPRPVLRDRLLSLSCGLGGQVSAVVASGPPLKTA